MRPPKYRFFEHHLLTVSTTPTPFPSPSSFSKIKNPEAIFLQTPSSNAAEILVGGLDVSLSLLNGFLLPPSTNGELPIFPDEDLFAVSFLSNQKLIVTYLAGT